jgi:hypothetical protein
LPLIGRVQVIRLWQSSQRTKPRKDGVSREAEEALFMALNQFDRQDKRSNQK